MLSYAEADSLFHFKMSRCALPQEINRTHFQNEKKDKEFNNCQVVVFVVRGRLKEEAAGDGSAPGIQYPFAWRFLTDESDRGVQKQQKQQKELSWKICP